MWPATGNGVGTGVGAGVGVGVGFGTGVAVGVGAGVAVGVVVAVGVAVGVVVLDPQPASIIAPPIANPWSPRPIIDRKTCARRIRLRGRGCRLPTLGDLAAVDAYGEGVRDYEDADTPG